MTRTLAILTYAIKGMEQLYVMSNQFISPKFDLQLILPLLRNERGDNAAVKAGTLSPKIKLAMISAVAGARVNPEPSCPPAKKSPQ